MFISWGTKYDSIGELNEFLPEKCQICNETKPAIYRVEQGYFNLYGLPLFPTSKKFYKICPQCKTRLNVRTTDSNFETLKRKVKTGIKFKYIWGWLILGPILIGLVYFVLWVKSLK